MTTLSPPDLAPKAKLCCLLCGGKLAQRRCRPCQKDTPRPGGAAWRRWTRGIDRVVRARLDAAGLGRLWASTWEALLLDAPMPAETATLVADIATLPLSPKRYQAALDRAVTRSQIMYALAGAVLGSKDDPHKADNIAGIAAQKIWAQRDRVAAGEAFERRHDAKLVHEAVVEYEARATLKRCLRGEALEAAVRAAVAREAERVRGLWGRPSDEYPRAARVEAATLRIGLPPFRVDDAVAEDEAAEAEATAGSRIARAA